MQYAWPGNVRQLRHCIEAAMNFVDDNDTTISTEHLPKYLFPDNKITELEDNLPCRQIFTPKGGFLDEVSVFDAIEQDEKEEILKTLLQCKGNVTESAKYLGISRQALIYRMRKYNISKNKVR